MKAIKHYTFQEKLDILLDETPTWTDPYLAQLARMLDKMSFFDLQQLTKTIGKIAKGKKTNN
ncbi:MAG: hypothetical protein AMJ75_00425 [Phycisphaerae bacterium SM1_79]|nr:MAG: hypothetical protein AMJ75_00425 [Phycisphaerae bacterium SM1_79]